MVSVSDIGAWVKEIIRDVTSLTANVKHLQQQVDGLTALAEKYRQEIADLRADLRVAKEEMKTVATNTAAQTVISAHTQIYDRFRAVEELVRDNERKPPRLDGQ
jgi:uncharacterized coiled-coil DUF342 family protein